MTNDAEDPYVFICHSHSDREVFDEIPWLQSLGVNVWYDKDITPGSEWTDTLARHIQDCEHFLYYVTPRSVESEYCRRELSFAQDENKPIIAVQLEPTQVPPGLRLSLHHRQFIVKPALGKAEYEEKILQCLETRRSTVAKPVRGSLKKVALISLAVFFLIVAGTLVVDRSRLWLTQAGINVALRLATIFADPVLEIGTGIAVLPFTSLSIEQENEYFSEGVTNDIIGALVNTNTVPVISRYSSFRFRNENQDLRRNWRSAWCHTHR